MQHIVQEVVETLKTFVGHGEQSVMLIEAATDEAPLLLKCFDIVERDELSNDIFLMHGDEFQDTRLFCRNNYRTPARTDRRCQRRTRKTRR